MSGSRAADEDRGVDLRRRVLLLAASVALAGVVGAAEKGTPYDVRVDAEGGAEAGLPEGTLALVAESAPEAGEVAAYRTAGDDLAASPVQAVEETDEGRFYTMEGHEQGPSTIVGDGQVLGRLEASASHVGTPWALPLTVQGAVGAILVGGYLGAAILRSSPRTPPEPRRILRRLLRL